jgi:ribonucleoside-diphosphate reductase alpha chain
VSNYPLAAQAQEAMAKRRIGLGVTGLADALIMLGLRYGSDEAVACVDRWMGQLKSAAYAASAALARERGAFSLCDADKILATPGLASLPERLRDTIRRHGLRNGVLTSIAPTGTISLLAGNVSSGIEPVFDFAHRRRILQPDGSHREHVVENFAFAHYRAMHGPDAPLTDAFVASQALSPRAHLTMQAAAQVHIDSSISKTINCPEDMAFEAFSSIYLDAYDLGLKGCTTYRPNGTTGAVLVSQSDGAHALAAETTGTLTTAPSAFAVRETGDVVYLSEPLARASALEGVTYKLKWPGSDHAMYITINDTNRNGRRAPFEIFINSKNLEHYAWTLALTRMISAVFRRGGDVSFVVDELKAVFDPQGGRWMDGAYVPSLLAAIGGIIDQHLHAIGFHSDRASAQDPERRPSQHPHQVAEELERASGGNNPPQSSRPPDRKPGPSLAAKASRRYCPKCASATLVHQEGCWTCSTCGYSKCN